MAYNPILSIQHDKSNILSSDSFKRKTLIHRLIELLNSNVRP